MGTQVKEKIEETKNKERNSSSSKCTKNAAECKGHRDTFVKRRADGNGDMGFTNPGALNCSSKKGGGI